jgi:branched-chain amino acid transport system substrate-binding protein
MSTQDMQQKGGSSGIKIVVGILLAVAIGVVLYVNLWPPGDAPDEQKILVTAIVPFSGKGASHGEYIREGVQMYLQDHPNSRIEVKYIDSESDPQKAVSGFQQQIALQKPRAAISALSGVSGALAPVAESNQILLIGVNTATNTFVEDYSWTQRINDRPVGHTTPIAEMAAKRLNRVGVIYANGAFGLMCKATFETDYQQTNTNELIFEPFNPSERDQSLLVQRVLSKQPDAVYVGGYGQGYISIFQALRTFNYGGEVFADIDLSNPTVLSALGDVADGIVFAAMDFNVTPPSSRQAAEFLERYQSQFKREPWLGVAFAYDALAILDHLESAKKPLDRQSIFALKEWPGIAAKLSFPSPGECAYDFSFVQRMEGKNVPVDLNKLKQ